MTAINFCYWLQGAHEIAGWSRPDGDDEREMIERHIALVPLDTLDTPTSRFVRDLRGALAFRVVHWPLVWDRLSECFQHEIDKLDARPQKVLNDIHNGGQGGPVYRC